MRRLRWLLGVLVVGGLVWGGYRQYQDPRVRGLFGPSTKRRPPVASRPVEGSSPDLPRQRPAPARPPEGSNAKPVQATPPMASQTLSSTILGILAARGLVSGVSLSVDEDHIEVRGIVTDAEKRREIMDVLNKARGHRSLDASLLFVAGSTP